MVDEQQEAAPRDDDLTLRKMIDLHRVLEVVPVGRTTVFRMISLGTFPPGRVVAGRKLWFEEEVARWQRNLETTVQHGAGRFRSRRRVD